MQNGPSGFSLLSFHHFHVALFLCPLPCNTCKYSDPFCTAANIAVNAISVCLRLRALLWAPLFITQDAVFRKPQQTGTFRTIRRRGLSILP